jgi:hypothetical protein
VDVSCFNCTDGFLRDGSRCPVCKGEGWIEILGAGMVDPNVFSYVSEFGYDPERHQGFAWGMGIERIAMLKHGGPGSAPVLRERLALPGAVRMRLPLLWLHDYCDPGLRPRALDERLTMTGTKVEAILAHGVDALEHFVIGRVLEARAASERRPPERLHRASGRGRHRADRLRRAQRRPGRPSRWRSPGA